MEILFLVGRILLGGFFAIMGITHFTKTDMISGVAQSRGIPSPRFGTIISGLLLMLGGLGIMLGVYIEISIWLLVVFLVVAALSIHRFWNVSPEQKMGEMMNFMRNMALIGALLIILYLSTPWGWSIGELLY